MKFSKAKPAADGKKRVDIAVPAFGYKNHIAIDRRHGFIRGWSTTSAAAYDGAQLPNVLDKNNTGSTVWAGDSTAVAWSSMFGSRLLMVVLPMSMVAHRVGRVSEAYAIGTIIVLINNKLCNISGV